MCDKAFLSNQAKDEDGLNWGRVNMIEKYKGQGDIEKDNRQTLA